jgi:hypothetical protein
VLSIRQSVTFNDVRADGGSNYGTALIGNRTEAFVRRALDADVPFFAYVAPHAPHEPATPAPWYAELYGEAAAPRTAAWNVSSRDKHWLVAVQAALTAEYVESKIDAFYRNRLRRHRPRHPWWALESNPKRCECERRMLGCGGLRREGYGAIAWRCRPVQGGCAA